MRPWNRRVGFGLLALGVLALALLLRPSPARVEVAEVTRGEFVRAVEEDGRTRVRERYAVNAPLTGMLDRSRVKAGDAVEPGTLLAIIHPLVPPLQDVRTRTALEARVGAAEAAREQARAALSRAEAGHRFALSEVSRARVLERQGAVTARELERAELKLREAARELEAARAGEHQAAHELEQARAMLGGGPGVGGSGSGGWELRSPIRGAVLRVFKESAGFVASGEPLFELGNPEALEVVVDLLTTEAVHVRPGQEVELLDWGGRTELRGRVRRVEPSAVTKVSALGVEEQRVDVLIDFTSPPETWRTLGDGYRVEARIGVQRTADVVKVPEGALFRQGDTWAVFVVEDGRARARTVRVGEDNGLEVIVEEGLRPGERVILHPGDTVREGARVAPR
ncbi:efflux RND transporter periplasmic adaptor subunit [Myxococcus sp. RHSTA-1-4]|uniref:efflux RND transporter periplasmic adaptor subunit n=1 Tax=Myxococcus sp. RHSTA-1-4 TaxID=2874601 RepID=UPI001CBA783B|nr:HlyD family efflux transporter periplasmic adaptor subunit [Myxococcus sp. RHSTA-1-4]MBZ4420244.1 HlyD family efflux transporter periplasmic adaptor subunit [Myxococcus sp. RHSTA-1-4]